MGILIEVVKVRNACVFSFAVRVSKFSKKILFDILDFTYNKPQLVILSTAVAAVSDYVC